MSAPRDTQLELATGATLDGSAQQAGLSAALSESVVSVQAPDAATPARIGRYLILRRLGEGGMGVVYSAYDPDLDRKVALKLVRDSRRQGSLGRARIMREAQAMAQVSHSHVAHVYEVGECDGQLFIAMEFVLGMSLSQWQQRHAKEASSSAAVEAILRLYIQAGSGLLAAHQLGIVHRDFKPDNVLVGDDGRVRVVDFGLARPLVAPGQDSGPALPAADGVAGASDALKTDALKTDALKTGSSPRLTQVGVILGTPGYMSPEQTRGDESDARSDQFSFCVALYEALHHQLPFAGDTFEDYALNLLANKRLPSPTTSDVPLVVERALHRGLSIDPAARFPSMQELLDALQAGLNPETETVATRSLNRRLGALHLVMVSCAIVLAGLLGLRAAGETMFPTIIVGGVLVVLRSTIAFVYRRQMSLHPRYQRLNFLFFVITGYILLSRIIGYSAGLTRSQYISVEMIGLGALMLAASRQIDRRMAWIAAYSVLASVLMRLLPTVRPLIVSAYYPTLAVVAMLLTMRVRSSTDD